MAIPIDVHVKLSLVGLLLLSASASATAQSSNGTITLLQEQMTSGGGQLGAGNPMRMWTALGDPIGGASSGVHCRMLGGYDPATSALPPGHPPAMPTVVSTPSVAPGPIYTLTGTKTAGTSVWVCAEGASASGGNCVEVVPLNDDTTWTFTVPLVEGDNVFVIVTKDAAGHVSASVTKTIVVDNVPPVITDVILRDPDDQVLRLDPRLQPPLPKTNFSQVTIHGEVDDYLTVVQIDGARALREGRRFALTLPLQAGTNALTMLATSDNGHVSRQTIEIVKGTIPTIQMVQPVDRRKLYLETTPVLTATATDQEQDPMTYQFLVDGRIVRDWASVLEEPWLLTEAHLGRHTIEVRARDAFGGSASQQVRVHVLRKPVHSP